MNLNSYKLLEFNKLCLLFQNLTVLTQTKLYVFTPRKIEKIGLHVCNRN